MDFGAFVNVMLLYVANKINAKWDKNDAQMIQLGRYLVQAIGELRDVLIILSKNDRVHQRRNIIIVDILEAYGLLLSRDWSSKLQGYFATSWSHLWLPYIRKNHHIRVETKPHMKYMVTSLKGKNDLATFVDLIFGNYFLETGCYLAEITDSTIYTVGSPSFSLSLVQMIYVI